jgi:rRNA maturation protein Nop10
MIYFIIYILLAFTVALASLTKRIGFAESLFISLFSTPVFGLIIVLKSKDNIITRHFTMKHTCSECGNQGIQEQKVCSICGNKMEISYNESKLTLA